MMRRHLSSETWGAVIKAVEELRAPLKPLLEELGVSRSSYYRKRREYLAGEIASRKAGSGRPKTYTVEMYGKRIVETLRQLPPTVGHRRVWLKLRGEGLSRNTVWRLMKEMELLLPRQRGKCRRRYEALRAARCDEVWTADTTYWPVNGSGMWIYVAMDVKSRWTPYVEPYLWRSGASSVEFFMNAFGEGKPQKLVTDKGSEFISGDLQALLKVEGVEWQGLPQNTPEARGLIERLNLTLKREWLLWKEPQTLPELRQSLQEFKRWYNQREHESLDWKTPEECYRIKASPL